MRVWTLKSLGVRFEFALPRQLLEEAPGGAVPSSSARSTLGSRSTPCAAFTAAAAGPAVPICAAPLRLCAAKALVEERGARIDRVLVRRSDRGAIAHEEMADAIEDICRRANVLVLEERHELRDLRPVESAARGPGAASVRQARGRGHRSWFSATCAAPR